MNTISTTRKKIIMRTKILATAAVALAAAASLALTGCGTGGRSHPHASATTDDGGSRGRAAAQPTNPLLRDITHVKIKREYEPGSPAADGVPADPAMHLLLIGFTITNHQQTAIRYTPTFAFYGTDPHVRLGTTQCVPTYEEAPIPPGQTQVMAPDGPADCTIAHTDGATDDETWVGQVKSVKLIDVTTEY
jgi:hypothetical protein